MNGMDLKQIALVFSVLSVAAVPTLFAQATSGSAEPTPGIGVNEDSNTVRVEKEITTRLVVPAIVTQRCAATITISFQQRNTAARVEGAIENPTCTNASGTYEINVSTRDAAGETRRMQFSEVWQQVDSNVVEFNKDYEIGAEVDLTRVQVRSTHCECVD
jgi:hypothetical protein